MVKAGGTILALDDNDELVGMFVGHAVKSTDKREPKMSFGFLMPRIRLSS